MPVVEMDDGARLEFPDGMSRDDMRQAILTKYNKPAPDKPAADDSFEGQLQGGESPSIAGDALRDAEKRSDAFSQMKEGKKESLYANRNAQLADVAARSLDITGMTHEIINQPNRMLGMPDMKPLVTPEQVKNFVFLPPGSPGAPKEGGIGEGIEKGVSSLAASLSDPDFIAQAVAAKRFPTPVLRAWQGEMIGNIPEATKRLMESKNLSEAAEAGVGLAADIGFPAGIERGLNPKSRAIPLDRAMVDATAHENAVLQLGKQRGQNVTLVDDLGPGRIARPVKDGGIQISRPELSKWLEGHSAEEVPKLIESLLDEETIHGATSDSDATEYAKNLTAAERALITRRYLGPGKWGGLNLANVGHEALRFELQRLGQLSPREILEAKGKELFKVNAITALERTIRAARETLGTKASKSQTETLNKYADKLRLIREAQGLPATSAPADTSDEGELGAVSDDVPFAINKELKPDMETARRVAEMSPDDFVAQASGFNRVNLELGRNATPQDVAELKELAAKASTRFRDAMKKAQETKSETDLDDAIKLSSLPQFFNEAIAEAGKQPAAFRKPKPGEQEELKLPVAPGAERQSAEELGATTEQVTPAKLGEALSSHLNESRPSFAAFADDVQKKFGNVQPGQLKEVWRDGLWTKLMSAKGTELAKLRDSLGLKGVEGLGGDIPDAPVDTSSGETQTAAARDALIAKSKRIELKAQKAEQAAQVKRRAAQESDPMSKLDAEAAATSSEAQANKLRSQADEIARQARTAAPESLPKVAAVREAPARGKRENIIARIGEKLLRQAETEPRRLQRSSVTPEDIGWWREKEGVAPAFSTFDAGQAVTPDTLTSGGAVDRTGRKAMPESASKRLTALKDNLTGKVDLVSTYKTGEGRAYMVDPSNPGAARPHVPINDLLQRKLSNGKPRFSPIGSVLLDEPVQRFHQRLTADAWTEFYDAAENEAQRRKESASEAAALPQPEFDESRPALRTGTSMTDAEAGAVLDHLYDEVGSITAPEDMQDAIDALSARATENKLNGRDFQVINALEKAVAETQRRNPSLSPVEAMEATLSRIYENASTSENREAFVQKALSDFGKKPAETVRPDKEVAPSQNARELTMLDRRPPTAVAGEKPPAGPGPAPTEAAPEEPGPFAYRKGSELGGEFYKAGTGIRAMFRRAPVNVDIAAHLDSFDTAGNNLARQKGNSVRIPASGQEELHAAVHVIEARGSKDALLGFVKNIKAGMLSAIKLAKEGKTFMERYEGRKWQQAAQRMADSIDYAYANWDKPSLQATAAKGKRALDDVYEFDKNRKVKLDYRGGYIPGRYEGEVFNDNVLQFGNQQLVLGRNWRKAKAFPNYSEAMKEGYIPVNRDLSDLVEHRVRQSWREGGKELWLESLKSWMDPDSGEAIVSDLARTETTGPMKRVTDANGQITMAPSAPKVEFGVPSPDYVKFSLGAGKDAVAVRRGYENLLKTLTLQGHISMHPAGDAALHATGFLKHGVILILDTFHPARLGQYAVGISNKPGFRKGFHVLEYGKDDMQAAADKGLIPQSSVDWANGTIDVRLPTPANTVRRTATGTIDIRSSATKPTQRTAKMTRREVVDFAQEQGLNVGRISDALYKESVRRMPVIGALNRFTFDKLTRGLMSEGAVSEFERLNKAFPGLNRNEVMKQVVRDINRYYGSLGRQGVFRNPTIREFNQLLFLAPQWVEGLIQKEVRAGSRAVTGPYNAARNLFVEDAEKRIPFGTIGRGMGRGLAAYFALTQVINLITRRQTTFQNKEDGHKLDAWIPGGKDGFFISPLSVFAEVAHDIIRYAETKPKFADAVNQLGYNKLGPWGRFAAVIGTQRNAQGEKLTSTSSIYKEAVLSLVPFFGASPISLSKVAREAGHAVMPGTVSPNPPGAMQRQLMGSLAGVKTELAPSKSMSIGRKAQQFVIDHGWKPKGFDFEMTDEPSYSKLRSAVKNGDEHEAGKIIASLKSNHTDSQIVTAMRQHVTRPLTGSANHEAQFRRSLSPEDAKLYDEARAERKAEWEKFVKLWKNGKR